MEFVCDSKYIVLPVNEHAQKKRLYFYIGEELVYDLVAPVDPYEPEQKFYIDIERFRGKKIILRAEPELEFQIEKSDAGVDEQEAYAGKYRPLSHFTAKRGWLNDPNGLVCYQGKYLMFYQHNPAACMWENMHWGYARSSDLMHWEEQDIALFPDRDGTMFSGCALIDKENLTGLKTNENDVILLFYTCAGSTSQTAKDKPFTQCLAYSTDGGTTFVKYAGNPLVSQLVPGNRDPKVIYHKESGQYVMALYLDHQEYLLLVSQNLLDWKELQKIKIPGEIECPDFYPLAVDDDPDRVRWVLIGASDRYYIGSFDGTEFKTQMEAPGLLNYGGASYASQSFSDMPDGRRIRMSFYSGDLTGMPFASCMSIPSQMSLKTINGKEMLCACPVDEIRELYGEVSEVKEAALDKENRLEMPLKGKSYDIRFDIAAQAGAVFTCSFFGLTLTYEKDTGLLRCQDRETVVRPEDGVLDFRIITDTICTEIYANKGSVFMGIYHIQDGSLNRLQMSADSQIVKAENIWTARLNEFWKK